MEVTELEVLPEAAPRSEASQSSALANIASVEDIDAQLRRAEKMGEALDKIRTMAIKRTVPSDWISMGRNLYLEGDGALRIAPMIGLQLFNVRKQLNVVDGGVVRVTMRCDARSMLFGTRFDGLEKTRATDDDFLTQNGKKERADLEDVEAAAYKGLVARAVQLLCGLSGLTPEEARDRFGLGVEGTNKVNFKGGQSEAKASDAAGAADAIKDVHRILRKVFEGDDKAAADWLEAATVNKEKGWPGKRDPNKLTEKGAAFVLKKLREMELKYDADLAASEGGAE